MVLLSACTGLSKWERLPTYTELRRSQIVKFYCIRHMNVLSVFLGRWLIQTYPSSFILNENLKGEYVHVLECGLPNAADTFAIFMLVAIVIMPPINAFVFPLCSRYIWPWLLTWSFFRCILPFEFIWRPLDKLKRDREAAQEANQSDPNRKWSEFCLSDEYLDVLYRQFIVFIGMTIVPLIAALGCAACVLDYFLVRLRLLRFHRRPPPMEGSFKTYLMVLLLVAAALAVFSFPAGTIWLLVGYRYKNRCPGSLWTYGITIYGFNRTVS